MTARAKFLFDEDFGAPKQHAPQEQTVALAAHAAEVRRTDEAAFQRGFAEGRRRADAEQAARLAAAMQHLAMAFADASRHFKDIGQRSEQHAAMLALALARKLSGALLERFPLAHVEELARSVLGNLRGAPHVVVRVNADLIDAVRPRLEAIAQEAGFTGAIVTLAEPDMAAGDARIEWADGGASRDQGAVEAILDQVVRAYLELRAGREEGHP